MRKKPIFFEAACLLSIAGSSIGLISMCISTFFFDVVAEKIRQVTNITTTDKLSPIYFGLLMAAFSVSLAGAIKLNRMQRGGLFMYLAAQAAILFLPVIWLGANSFSMANAIFTFLFSAIYLFYYKILIDYSYDNSAMVSR